jgi:hypothetical protein
MIALTLAGAGQLIGPGHALADRVFLTTGSMIEGKATRVGEKVIVEMDAGYITLSAGAVQRVEQAESEVQRLEARTRELAPNDVQGLFVLADYCRDRGMKAREEDFLRRIIALVPDHPEARARLGYVRTDAGWVTRDEQMRAQGFVKHEGRWLTPEQYLAVQRLEAETRMAQLQRDQAQVELDTRRAELAGKKAEQAQRAREHEQQQAKSSNEVTGLASYFGPFGYGGGGFLPFYPTVSRPGQSAQLPNPAPPPGPGPAPAPLPGFGNSSNTSFQIPGYKAPQSYFP